LFFFFKKALARYGVGFMIFHLECNVHWLRTNRRLHSFGRNKSRTKL